MSLKRAWCIFEIFKALQFGATIELAVTKTMTEEIKAFNNSDIQKLAMSVGRVNSAASQASREHDRPVA